MQPEAVGETKRLQFTTEVRCALGSDDDSLNACNQASVCSDNDPRTNDCFLSDVDNALPVTPTCLDFPWTNYLGSTKSVAFDDRDGDGGLSAGDTLRYTIRVNNAGRKTGQGVSVVDTLDPSCMDFTTVSPGSGSFDPGLGTISWGVGDIPTGDTVQLSFSVDAVGTGPQCCNQAAINGREREACSGPDLPCEGVDGHGGQRDDERVLSLSQAEGQLGVARQPGPRAQERLEQRRQADGLAEHAGPAVLRQRARELRVQELVREVPRRRPLEGRQRARDRRADDDPDQR